MKWTVGLDLRREGKGALSFAAWLRGRDSSTELLGVHVLEDSPLLQALRDRDEVGGARDAARALAKAELDAAGLGATAEPLVLDGDAPADALESRMQQTGAEALIIGRRAAAQDDRWLRLGPVARRLLRRLPVPIVVVPPDLAIDQVGSGPIVLATDLGDDALGAAAFAKQLALATGRRVVVAHVMPPSDAAVAYVPAATLQQLYAQLGLQRNKSLEQWKRSAGLDDAATAVASGETVGRLIGIAQAENAPLIVTGARQASAMTRLFTASVGTSLAAHAPCSVAVVPADYRPST